VATPEQILDLKIVALREAADTFSDTDPANTDPAQDPDSQTTVILNRANRFYGWLMGVTRLVLRVGPVVGEGSDVEEPKHPASEGETVQINTGQKFSVTVDTRDAAGFPTDATVEWTIADESVATVTHDDADDQKGWVVSGAPGSTTLRVRVTDVEPPLEATLAVDVVPAGTATVEIATGPAVPEGDPQPEPLAVTLAEDTTDTSRMTVSFTADNKGEGVVTVNVGENGVLISNAGDGVDVTTYQYTAPGTFSVIITDDDNPTRTTSESVTVPYTA
jgi:hypothetical protein